MERTGVLHEIIEEIECLICKNENLDGSCAFDVKAVLAALELAKRMIISTTAPKKIDDCT